MKWTQITFLVLLFSFSGVNVLDARNAEEWYREAFEFSLRGMNENAISAYLQAVQIKPDWAEAHHGLAVVYDRLEDGVQAVFHLRKAEKLYQRRMGDRAKRNLAIIRANLKQAYEHLDIRPEEFDQIESIGLRPDSQQWETTGSGFIIGDQGIVLTTLSSVQGASGIRVRFSDHHLAPARLVRAFSIYNVAFIKIESNQPEREGTLRFGDSSHLKQGDAVFSVDFSQLEKQGEPVLPITGTVLGLEAVSYNEKIFQLRIDMDRRHSGGPLFNDRGELVAMTLYSEDILKQFRYVNEFAEGTQFALRASYLETILAGLPDWKKKPGASAKEGTSEKNWTTPKEFLQQVKHKIVLIETSS